jgi:delta 1-pyrroline-5-carboxylate dehydrogenase
LFAAVRVAEAGKIMLCTQHSHGTTIMRCTETGGLNAMRLDKS